MNKMKILVKLRMLKGTVRVVSSDPPCKDLFFSSSITWKKLKVFNFDISHMFFSGRKMRQSLSPPNLKL